jgi:hypothetical protein
MKKKPAAQCAFFNLRALIGLALCLAGASFAFLAFGLYPSAWAKIPRQNQDVTAPQAVAIVGPVSQDQDLRSLPYLAPNTEGRRATPDAISAHSILRKTGLSSDDDTSSAASGNADPDRNPCRHEFNPERLRLFAA